MLCFVRNGWNLTEHLHAEDKREMEGIRKGVSNIFDKIYDKGGIYYDSVWIWKRVNKFMC